MNGNSLKNNLNTLRMLRLSKNLTQIEIAKEFGVSPQCYARWEQHPLLVKMKNAIMISEFYDLSLNDIDWGRT